MATQSHAPEILDIPARDLLTVDGVGAPETPAFGRVIRALFAVRAALGGLDDVPLRRNAATRERARTAGPARTRVAGRLRRPSHLSLVE